jgi:Tol biopolymer transport system component
VYLFDRHTGRMRRLVTNDATHDYFDPTISADRSTLAAFLVQPNHNGVLIVKHLTGPEAGTVSRVDPTAEEGCLTRPSLSADGSRIAYSRVVGGAQSTEQVVVREIRTGILLAASDTRGRAGAVKASLDGAGRTLVYEVDGISHCCLTTAVVILDVPTGANHRLQLSGWEPLNPSISPSGRYVGLALYRNGPVSGWRVGVLDRSTGLVRTFHGAMFNATGYNTSTGNTGRLFWTSDQPISPTQVYTAP